jgi:enamine deaminase RidA (YjgF/YER057c/UK114 family)
MKECFLSVNDRLNSLGLSLPAVPVPVANYVPARQYGNLVFASGQTPTVDGALTMTGKLGAEISVEQGQEGARLSVLNCLAAVADLLGDLDRVEAVLKLTGYVASAPGFTDQPTVVNGASILLEQVLGDAGRHARAAIGLAELPGGAPVEVDLVLAVR